jgi:PAS domain S-box-containing protein
VKIVKIRQKNILIACITLFGLIFFSEGISQITIGWEETLPFLIGIVVLSGVIFSIMILTVEWAVITPIAQLSETVKAIQESRDLSKRITINRDDEIGDFSRVVNDLLAVLEVSQKTLKENEERYRAVVENQTELITRFKPDGTLLFVNGAFCRFFGKREADLLGRRNILNIPKSDAEQVERHYASFTPASPRGIIEHSIIMPDGSIHRLQWSDTAIFDDEGHIEEYQSVGRDVTEKRRIQEKIEHLASFPELDPNPILEVNSQGEIIFQNSATLSCMKMVGAFEDPRVFIPPDLGPISQELKLKKEQQLYREVPINQHIFGETISYIPKTETVRIYANDITARKQAEIGLQNLNQDLEKRIAERTSQLESANKELEAFSYSVSHDLRSPLRSIDGFSQALLEDYSDKLDADGQNYLRRVRLATQRMGELIDDILNLSRVSRFDLKRKPVDLTLIARQIIQDLHDSQPNRTVEFVAPASIVVNADENMVKILLNNLLGNAWKFTERHPAARIELGESTERGKPAYFIRDDGAGFEMAYVDKLFGAFQRLHSNNDYQGSGIGLAIVKRIVHRHGGEVWAQGAVEKGATFFFML